MTSTLETTDIFRGAFYLCVGGDLQDIRFNQSRRQIASFFFNGPDLHKHDLAYRNGQALVNPVQFREALNHLRDILFRQLRTRQEPRLSTDDIQKRKTRYDRANHDRPHQNIC